MEIIFLGTSAGAPTKSRNVSAIALTQSKGKRWHLIDCGEGTQHQLLYAPLTLNNLSTVFITHLHGDHFLGLPGLLSSAGLNGRRTPLTIVGPSGLQQWLEATMKLCDAWVPFDLNFVTCNADLDQCFGNYGVSVVALSHRIASYGYVFTELDVPLKLDFQKLEEVGIPAGPTWGSIQSGQAVEHNGVRYRADELAIRSHRGRKVIICGDNDNPELLEAACNGCDVLVHEATFTAELAEKAKRVGHSYAGLVASFAERVGVKNLILTHVSARYSVTSDDMVSEAKASFSGTAFVAKDYDKFSVGTDFQLQLNSDNETC